MEIIAQMASSRGQRRRRIKRSGIPRSVLFVVALFVGTDAFASDFPIACTYVENQPTAELESHAGCAARVGGLWRISDEHLAKMSYTTRGLASVLIDERWYYVKPDGDLLQVVTFDNGADYFSEGLTRSVVRGKIAYFDSKFLRVIPPKYDWGWPFEARRALVCIGCKPGKSDEDGHGSVDGGRWGFIDKSGKEIVPVTLTKAQALSH
jgi:WG containing repeat